MQTIFLMTLFSFKVFFQYLPLLAFMGPCFGQDFGLSESFGMLDLPHRSLKQSTRTVVLSYQLCVQRWRNFNFLHDISFVLTIWLSDARSLVFSSSFWHVSSLNCIISNFEFKSDFHFLSLEYLEFTVAL